jgi:hypothetical protein
LIGGQGQFDAAGHTVISFRRGHDGLAADDNLFLFFRVDRHAVDKPLRKIIYHQVYIFRRTLIPF